MRGHDVMMGYLKNPTATEEAFAGGWFHTGDLAVMHGDGYLEIKDRSKDIIISGGENISSIEVEGALYRHPDVLEAAVVARPDETLGREPVRLRDPEGGLDRHRSRADRALPPRARPLQGAQTHRLRPPAQDLDRQDPEVRAAGAGAGSITTGAGFSAATGMSKAWNR